MCFVYHMKLKNVLIFYRFWYLQAGEGPEDGISSCGFLLPRKISIYFRNSTLSLLADEIFV